MIANKISSDISSSSSSDSENENENSKKKNSIDNVAECLTNEDKFRSDKETINNGRNTKFTLFVLFMASCGSTMAHVGLLGVSIPHIEKYFKITSTSSGILSSVHDIGVCISAIIIGVINFKNPMKIIGIGFLFMIFGAIIFIIPTLLMPQTIISLGTLFKGEVCHYSQTNKTNFGSQCIENHAKRYLLDDKVILLYIGYFFIGIGGAFTVILGPIMLNKLSAPSKISKILGVFYVSAIIGPVIGYSFGIIANSALKSQLYQRIIVEHFNRDIGTWWMAYLMGILFFIAIFFLISYNNFSSTYYSAYTAKYVASPDRISKKNRTSSYDYSTDDNLIKKEFKKNQCFYTSLKIITIKIKYSLHYCRKSFGYLLHNWIYLILTCSSILTQFLLFGYSLFLPKFMIYNYGLTASISTIMAGIATIPAACLGSLFGAMVMNKLNSKIFNGAKLCTGLLIISTCLAPSFLIYCRDENYIYSEKTIPDLDIFDQFSVRCAKNCNCDKSDKFRACLVEKSIDFINPCIAGCTVSFKENNIKKYKNCSCMNLNNRNVTLVEGICPKTCGLMIAGVFCLFIINFCIFATFVPVTQMTLIVTKTKYQPIALSLQQFFQRGVGQCIGPIAIGNIIDRTCERWSSDSCLNNTNCMIYNMKTYRFTLFLVGFVVLFINSLLFLGIGYLSNNIKKDIDKAEENK